MEGIFTKQKITAYSPLEWVHITLATVLCGLGIALCTKADFGLSMLTAVPYIVHVCLRDLHPFITQGTAEYVWEAVLLILLCLIMQQFNMRYLFTYAAAILSGCMIDFWLSLLGGNGPWSSLVLRILGLAGGMCIGSLAVAFFFRTRIPLLQIYELFVTELSEKLHREKTTVKQWFDGSMLVLSIVLSLLLTKGFTGIGIGTVLITILNAPLIRFFGNLIDHMEQR